jgi:hypothetical protein
MLSRIDDMQAVLRLNDSLDIERCNRPAHDAEIDLLRLNEADNAARDHVPEIVPAGRGLSRLGTRRFKNDPTNPYSRIIYWAAVNLV